MPSAAIIIEGNGLNTLQEDRIRIEGGILQGLAVHSGEAAPAPNTTWAEVGIELGGESRVNRVCILAAGYVAGTQVLGWDGKIELEPTAQIYLRIWTTLTNNIYLGTLTVRP